MHLTRQLLFYFVIAYVSFSSAKKTSTKAKAKAEAHECVRGCYFTNWAHERKGRAQFKLARDYRTGLCTHILYSFFGFDMKGKKAYQTREMTTKDGNVVYRNGKPLFYKEFQELKKKDPKLKVLLSFGGWAFGQLMPGTPFLPMSKNPKNSKTFIDSAIKYATKYGFDGIDIDWEYPENHGEAQTMTKFLAQLRQSIDHTAGGKLLMTAAVPCGHERVNNTFAPEIKKQGKLLDLVFLMAYDMHGKWEKYQTGFNAPLYQRKTDSSYQVLLNTAAAANLWVHYGLPKEKLIVGLATYGRGWAVSNPKTPSDLMLISDNPKAGKYTKEAGFLAYYEICEMIGKKSKKYCGSKPGKSYYQKESRVPYAICGNEWTGYDNKKSIGEKVKHIKKKGYGGAFVWAMDLDDFNGKCPDAKGEKYPLLSVIEEGLGGQNQC